MKKQLRILAAMLTLSMALLFSACTSGTDNGTSTSQPDPAPAAITEEEYQQAVLDLEADLTEIQSQGQIDVTDTEAAKQLLEDLKQPFAEFMNINPPESYADAHAKIQSGCQAMIDYIDAAIALIQETDPEKLQALSETMMSSLNTAVTDLAEGGTMLDEAANA